MSGRRNVTRNKYVSLRDVPKHRLIRVRSDGRYGMTTGKLGGKFRTVDFWDGGLEHVLSTEQVEVIPLRLREAQH